MKYKKRNKVGFVKESFFELIIEVLWNFLMFIPRLIIRFIGSLW